MSETVKEGARHLFKGKINKKSILFVIVLVIVGYLAYIAMKISGLFGMSLTIEPPITTGQAVYYFTGATPNGEVDFSLQTEVTGSGVITWSQTADSTGRGSGTVGGSGSSTFSAGMQKVTMTDKQTSKTASAQFYKI